MILNDTICAIATASGVGAISVIRVSGEDSFTICDKIFSSPKNKKLSDAKTHTILFGKIILSGKIIDEVLVSIFRAPSSYTGENSVEISCHGGILVTKKVLDALVLSGCRLASRGEFTKRAFLNGKLDLSQAEGVIDVINAESVPALSISVHQLGGAISEEITRLRDELLSVIAQIDAAIDYPEEDVEEITSAEVLQRLKFCRDKIISLIETSDSGKFLRFGINTAIVGKPNVGKSSLLNTLLGENRAIVTEKAGTTRDVISEKLTLGNAVLNISDTAGIRDTDDEIESFGIDKTKECIKDADLVLFLLDLSAEINNEDKEIFELIKDKKHIVLANKTDISDKKIDFSDNICYISAKEKIGIDVLTDKIEEMFNLGDISSGNNDAVINLRHKEALFGAKECLNGAICSITENMPIDMASIDITSAISYLGEISGQTVSDEIIEKIFSTFCVGK